MAERGENNPKQKYEHRVLVACNEFDRAFCDYLVTSRNDRGSSSTTARHSAGSRERNGFASESSHGSSTAAGSSGFASVTIALKGIGSQFDSR